MARPSSIAAAVTAAQKRVHEACLAMVERRLIVGSAGNISERLDDTFFVVSPSGRLYHQLKPADYPVVNITDGTWKGAHPPTSELAVHRDLYRDRRDVGAVVHTHSRYAAAFAVARVDLPFVCNENIGPASERILVSEYGAPGTATLGEHAVATLARQPGSNAILLANHGVVAVGNTVEKALLIAEQVEWIAEVTHHAAALDPTLRNVVVLPIDQQDLIGSNYGFAVSREAQREGRSDAGSEARRRAPTRPTTRTS